jgi:hypothetical protein
MLLSEGFDLATNWMLGTITITVTVTLAITSLSLSPTGCSVHPTLST